MDMPEQFVKRGNTHRRTKRDRPLLEELAPAADEEEAEEDPEEVSAELAGEAGNADSGESEGSRRSEAM